MTARGPVTLPGDQAAWFEAGPLGPDAASLAATVEALHDTLDALCATHDLDRHRVVVAGFSQGGATALALALTEVGRPRPAAAACLSGYLADALGHDYDWSGASGIPVLIQHGTADDVVPFDLGRDTAAVLQMHGLPVTFRAYDGAHETTDPSISDARAWLERVEAGDMPAEPVER